MREWENKGIIERVRRQEDVRGQEGDRNVCRGSLKIETSFLKNQEQLLGG